MAAVEINDDGTIEITIGRTSHAFDVYEWAKKIKAMAQAEPAMFLEKLRSELVALGYEGLSLRAVDLFWQHIYKLQAELGKKNIWTPELLEATRSTNGEPADSTASPSADYEAPNDSVPLAPTAS